jgi:uncharacterized phiE125 gp8 family phage protein
MIDVASAKAWLKVETVADDALIGALVSSAIATIEAQTGKFMSAKEFTQELRGFPSVYPYEVRLFRGPVTDISSIEYDPADGTDPVAVTEFRLVEGVNARLLPAFGETWPSTLDGSGTVRITGTAGFVDDEAPELDTAALLLVAHWYQNREAVNVGNITTELPLAVDMLIQPYRSVRLG